MLVQSERLLKLGAILNDSSNQNWKIGAFIGSGGNGEVYTASNSKRATKAKNYKHVIKIESFENSFIIEEINFYQAHAKLEDIEEYKNAKNLKHIGLPHFISFGLHTIEDKVYRFLVIPRYGKDIGSFINQEQHALPEHTIYRLALHILDVLEYLHNINIVHCDIKAENILLGFGPKGQNQVYLVDFGTATPINFFCSSELSRQGTMNYNSRDGHVGLKTFRGDLETLGYNLIHWSGITLPWLTGRHCNVPIRFLEFKDFFMSDVENNLKISFSNTVPGPIMEFFTYIASLNLREKPDYEKCKYIFLSGLEQLGKINSGKFDLKTKLTKYADSNLKLVYKRREPRYENVVTSDIDSELKFHRKRKFMDSKLKLVPRKRSVCSENLFKSEPAKNSNLKSVNRKRSAHSEDNDVDVEGSTPSKMLKPVERDFSEAESYTSFRKPIKRHWTHSSDVDGLDDPRASKISKLVNYDSDKENIRPNQMETSKIIEISNCEENTENSSAFMLKPGESIVIKNSVSGKNQFATLLLNLDMSLNQSSNVILNLKYKKTV